MGEYDDAIEAVREAGLEDVAEVLDKFKATDLRKKAAKADQLEKLNADLTAKVEGFEKSPKREEAFRQAGVNFEELRPAEREVLNSLNWEGDQPTEEWVADQIKKYGFPTNPSEGTEEEGEEAPEAAQIAAAAQGAPTPKSSGTTIKPEEVNEWSTEKAVRFKDQHPDEFEALKRGETVTGVAFS